MTIKKVDGEKYIGLVKWFHDQARDANYGFIQHAKLGDLFFHERSIEQGQDIKSFRENAIVVFIAQESKKHKGKLEAVGVKYLDNETDLNFLFSHFLLILTEKGKYSDYNTIQKGVHSKIISLLEKLTDKQIIEQLFERFQNYVNEQIQLKSITDEEYLKGLLKVGKGFFPDNYKQIAETVEKNISVELAHKLWLDSFLEICQIDYVASSILSAPEQTQQKIFNRCSEDDKTNIFFKVLYSFDKIDTEANLKIVKQLLSLSKKFASEQDGKILAETIKNCPDYFKLSLWLEDYHETLDFQTYKLYTVTLSPKDQKRFVKKVLKYIHEEKVNISLEDLTSLNVIDFETSKLAEQIDNSKLDYSTSIILNVISELKTQTNLETRKDITSAQHRIYDLIIRQIKQPKDILQISGFFDECEGRCGVSVHEEKNDAGEIINRTVSFNRNEHNKAKNHPICDGRKAVNKTTKEPVLSDEKVEFWWCANQKCFKPSRQLHSSTDWEKYSLLDFLTILKVDFKETDLEIYLNIINKANRFLKHLNCRECNHILYPKGKSQYAFYGISHFACKTDDCSEKGKEIYLSHCLNGYCEMEIDSRDSVKCKPNGLEAESCGWYVCNYCNSCCSSEQLQRRKWVYDNVMHSEYKCHLEGHRNLGVISCNKCGDPMEANETNIEEYNRILNWFIENKDKSDRIHKSGKNKRDKW
ncbi:MAG: cold shock domain-containing protein [Cytophagales bacterium]